ncbi:MAG: hypothetical protein EXR59_05035 [Dehalococcoidia bacterium]|nr:hypothetical protein [Dehalococcoidia bacterium]
MDRIVFVSNDGNIFSVAADGTDGRNLTNDGNGWAISSLRRPKGQPEPVFYSWPTASLDGSSLAASKVTLQSPTDIKAELHTFDLKSGLTKKIHENPSGDAPFVAAGVPHYMCWSPDSKSLAFVGQDELRGLTLHVSNIKNEPPKEIISGSPIFSLWSGNSNRMLLHVGETMYLADIAAGKEPKELRHRSIAFRCFAWALNGTKSVYVARAPYRGGSAIYLADENGDNGQPVAPIRRGETVLVSSPSQEYVAFTEKGPPAAQYYVTLKLLKVNDIEVKTFVDEPLLAFFWAPDGEKIAFIGYDPSTQKATWKIIDVKNEKVFKLTDFVPSSELSTVIAFFDQYAQSHSPWSSNSRYLAFTGHAESRKYGSNGKHGNNHVYVIDIHSRLSPYSVGAGSMATWVKT